MHTLIVGINKSGKSKLAMSFAARKDGEHIVVFDPTRSDGWPTGSMKFSDPEAFLDYIEEAESKYVFIDEAKTLWDFDKDRAEALVYRGRHRGLYLFLIAQRTRMISPNGRNMCTRIFAFKQQKADAKVLADEYGEIMLTVQHVEPLQFVFTDGHKYQTGYLDFDDGGRASIVLDNRTV